MLVAVLLAVTWFASRPPSRWSLVMTGTTRSHVYSPLGEPNRTNESTKGGVRWRSNALVGHWEFDVFFHEDGTVGAFAKR
jgi:hypothetical protein